MRVGNRFCILPMEGWDGTADGEPTDLTFRRWRNFGRSGAKLIWGGEAVAVRHDGRANPNQLLIGEGTLASLERSGDELVAAHKERFGGQADRDLYVGLQLTHSGRFARPHDKDRPEPLVAYAHPVLDRRFPGGTRVITDDELGRLVEDFVAAARRAADARVPVRRRQALPRLSRATSSCPRATRRGPLRRLLREPHALPPRDRRRASAPRRRASRVGVRLSAFDSVPYRPGRGRRRRAGARRAGYDSAFGLLRDERLDEALDDSREFLQLLRASASAGSA